MNKNLLVYSLLMAAFLIFSGCRSSRKAVAVKPEEKTLVKEPAAELLEKITANEFRFDWFTAKADVDYYDASNEKTSFNINIRAKRDSVIWISVTPLLGIEVARAMITRDSVHLLDRIKHDYYSRDYLFLEDMFKTKISFDMLQAILTGNYFLNDSEQKIRTVKDESPYVFLSTAQEMTTDSGSALFSDTKKQQDFWINSVYRIDKFRIYDGELNRTLTVVYSDFIPVTEMSFARRLQVMVEASRATSMNIEYVKFTQEGPLSFPFSIPDKYNRK